MLTDRQSLFVGGIVVTLFFIGGLTNLLNNLIVKIILGTMFLLVIVNIFIPKKNLDDTDESEIDNTNLFK
ncbi:hypothetical protein [Lacinutrix venerupis]|uniref:Uncharacterized protein n=1 Tax=Lacinutrix venerupis TaxID=1486034 RepID=A0AAC9LN22_9FLAO|nr:hypothetical protein [Lacinutrix venerupis]APX99847.1 hypothetical protein BWR22_05835 [Lacinutrix venerupis]